MVDLGRVDNDVEHVTQCWCLCLCVFWLLKHTLVFFVSFFNIFVVVLRCEDLRCGYLVYDIW